MGSDIRRSGVVSAYTLQTAVEESFSCLNDFIVRSFHNCPLVCLRAPTSRTPTTERESEKLTLIILISGVMNA